MDNLNADFAFLVEGTRRLIAALRNEFLAVPQVTTPPTSSSGELELHAEVAASSDTHQIAALVRLILDTTEHQLERTCDEFTSADHALRLSLLRSVRLHAKSVRGIHEAVPWLEAASQPFLGLGFQYFLKEAISALLKAEAHLIAIPEARYNYTAAPGPPFHEIITRGLSLEYPVDPKLVVVSFPVQERQTLLLQPLLVHEIAHYAVEAHNLRGQVISTVSVDLALDIELLLGKARTHLMQTVGVPQERANSLIGRMNIEWTDEVLCDALALRYLGPAYLLAFVTAVHPIGGPGAAGPSHPPNALRIAFMCDAIEASDWKGLAEERLSGLWGWLKYVAQQPRTPSDRFPEPLDDVLVKLRAAIYATASDHLGDLAFRGEDFELVDKQLSDLLDLRVFPAQLKDGSAPDRRAILCAVWFYLLGRYGTSAGELARMLRDNETQILLAKALEMSAVLDTWQGSSDPI